MKYILCTVGIVASFYLLKYRERVGDMIGDAEWMRYVGGVYGLVTLTALILFFWSIAELTNTTEILFSPLLMILPAGRQVPADQVVF